MRKRYLLVCILAIVLVFSLVGCTKDTGENISNGPLSTEVKSDSVEGLTMEERLKDFEYLYNYVLENYPLLKVNERINGVDWVGKKDDFEKTIENTKTDQDFIDALEKMLEELNDIYTGTIGLSIFKRYYGTYTSPQYKDNFKPWVEVLNQENVIDMYDFDESQLALVEDSQYASKEVGNLAYCKTDIVVPNEVGYIKIYKFESDRIEEDGKIIRDFLMEIKDYDKLIVDIRDKTRTMGDDDYWIKNIVEPLAKEDITAENYLLMKGSYGKEFYEYRGMDFAPISELSSDILDKFANDAKTDFDYYHLKNKTIKPVDPIGFNGKIYLLVDKTAQFSSENFAAFCKDSAFATVVGKTTSGRSFLFDTIFVPLPSGIVIETSGLLMLNRDGTIRQEAYVVPDIEIDTTIGSSYERDNAIEYIVND